ncbi:EAL domain-containing protein, partial [Mycobacterium tuberculosis]|nr:EAL domain-containing protein [Mycobacterium tuberculosis]
VPPADFIQLAEETGLITPIGSWMLGRACAIAAGWPVPVRVAVNMSPRQIKSRGLYDEVAAVLADTGLAPDRLELEITESVLLEETEEIRDTLTRLKGLGVKISMDDFGTGYSSLSCLRSFPFDKIKIDQSFIRTMATAPETATIVRSVLDMARA